MSTGQYHKAMWLVNLLRRYGALTRSQINSYWRESSLSNGTDIPRRSFFNFRDDVNRFFNITISCNPKTYEYYLEEDEHSRNMTSWIVHTQALNNVFVNSHDVSHLIFLEDVPSSRSHLELTVEALKSHHPMKFDYAPYTRTTPSRGVILEPYFLKLFKQRWYITGLAVLDDTIKTYSLDRILNPSLLDREYKIPDDFDAETYFRDSFGIVFTQGEVKDVKLRVDARQAKYFRAVPLHHSQQEMVHDSFSIFTYRMKISPDFVDEILSHGPRVTVIQPPELRAMVVTELKASIDNYTGTSVKNDTVNGDGK